MPSRRLRPRFGLPQDPVYLGFAPGDGLEDEDQEVPLQTAPSGKFSSAFFTSLKYRSASAPSTTRWS